ncbi:MAG: hypothetical protein HRU19_00225 [Pseudobacteriovorax sp.]|nr:hypothetical protein [Pseudobacteriovorax sp.]
MSNRVDQLEYTVMELGSQVFRLKQELNSVLQSQGTLQDVIKNLRSLLEEKGQLDSESFDLITEFYRLKEALPEQDETEETDDTLKKTSLH